MKIKLLAFGIAKDILKAQKMEVSIPQEAVNIHHLKEYLLSNYPEFSKLRSLSLAVNDEYQEDDFSLNDRDEVVIIPPVSGG